MNNTRENGAWVYIGNGDEMNRDSIIKKINEHFDSDNLYIAHTRNESIEISKKYIGKAIESILGRVSFLIWDTNFKKVIEFDRNGVMRFGEFKD